MQQIQPPTGLNRVLAIDGTINFRDLGGYLTDSGEQVRWGRLYRSAQLDRLSAEGIKTLSAMEIKTVVDLRFSNESERFPTIREAVPQAELISWNQLQEQDSQQQSSDMQFSWSNSLDSHNPHQVREAMRLNYPKKLYSHRAVYRQLLLRLAEQKTPLIFHCAAGKDRTGVAAALILSVLGVSQEQIIEDYLLTQQELENRIHSWFAGGAGGDEAEQKQFQERLSDYPEEVVKPIFDADISYIQTLLEYVEEKYQGFENYALTQLQLSADNLAQIRAHLLQT